MTDIVERLRREAVRFNEMDAAGDQPWVADAAWAADNFSAAAAEIERLRAALRQFADCELHDGNCASLDVAAKRIRAIARAALGENSHD